MTFCHHLKNQINNTMEYFTIFELEHSDTAMRLGIKNAPTREQEQNLITLIEKCLDPCRRAFGRAINVSSGFRCATLNAKVGGETDSQHKKGQAVDLYAKTNYDNYLIGRTIIEQGNFDQLIFENCGKVNLNCEWIHVSYNEGKNRKQILKKVKGSKVYQSVPKSMVI